MLKRDWHTLSLIYAKREQRLPNVLSIDEVRKILHTVRTPQNKAFLTTVYAVFGSGHANLLDFNIFDAM